MNRQQKIAWFTLTCVGLALGLSLLTFGVLYLGLGWPVRAASGAFGFIGLLGFAALAPLLFRKDKGQVAFDERDLQIQRTASLAAFATFWAVFVSAAMVPWFIIGPEGRITVNYLPWMVFGGMLVVEGVRAVVTLQGYGWRSERVAQQGRRS
jgi:hypothetical protein